MNKIKLFLSIIFFTLFLSFDNVKDNPYLSTRMKIKMIPHLLPENHPLKESMDNIFMARRVIASTKSLKEAGFATLFAQPRSQIFVLRHPELPNHLVKLTLDPNLGIKYFIPDWQWFVRRCVGAKKIRQIITEKKLKLMTVPQKWLYVLPATPKPRSNIIPKVVVLLVEEMQLVDAETNLRKWKHEMTKAHLDELFQVMSYGGRGSGRPDNVWFTVDGKLAFIDTEYPNCKAVYESVKKYLSKENSAYWTLLMLKYGKD